MFEAYTTLGFLAVCTTRMRLGTRVTAARFRPPALLVKAVTTLDVLSGGRAWFGIGAGHHRGWEALLERTRVFQVAVTGKAAIPPVAMWCSE
ncbi:LLM class flavin-dependent oxidoreductase [Rhodococcus aetherivorans]|uniref:LLM class flavin-dependent oxidoreductase n=1 Tax=Rhodococcus aetherivorans TaxID=191292 RepID=UPI00368D41DF